MIPQRNLRWLPLAMAPAAVFLFAQSAPPQLDARASDPVALGWMVGSPPPADKLIRFDDGSFFQFPRTRWSFSHIRELIPTRAVVRSGSITLLPKAERAGIDAISFHPIGQSSSMTWAESLSANYTDGILALHKGKIVYERYFSGLQPHQQHIAFSVTKSFVATLAATLIQEGVLNERSTVASYVPELSAGGFGDATIRQLLDMTTGVKYSENYVDPNSPIWEFSRANGFLPRPRDYRGATTSYGFLQTLAKEYPHGERFVYKTVNTDVLAWVMSRVTGKPLTDLVQQRIWSRMGMESDAYFTLDSAGTEFAGGGLNLTLRDLARFGEMIRLRGRFNGQQIILTAVIDDIQNGGSREQFAQAGYKTLPGWSYRDMWWVSHNSHNAFSARGVHGQAIYIDPKAEMVIARFASHPMAGNVNLDSASLPAYEALAAYLKASTN